MQKHIARIKDENPEKFMTGLNRIAIEEGLEDVKELRQDGTAIETNIHYPTNNSLVYDCIKESGRLLEHLKEEPNEFSYEEYRAKAKRMYFKIKVEKDAGGREKEFKKQLKLFRESTNRVSNIVKKKSEYGTTTRTAAYLRELEELRPVMERVYWMTWRHEIVKEKVPVGGKIFSIYEGAYGDNREGA
jgi:IS5 family transposase